ncbi:hypothetical protein K493DRAFT_360421 [Basidiobolus meristosporus CBS 931.73]|uniref:Tim17-domain-containing protein n=1 Tax=Basidiobolus meristosporus CBS 931.73 TaxID=1314790 RepID=A0A1Y1XHZ7_9FUNG|nr:hypothetical protein K493DRAFT_360421 [Basidiobolus meristosporus CBS 931.73]|eukprot:ORX85370.1 hypothetical protein K493DRAFT_360421 [Basidiobolus meristosporus CBS 931.73]
MEAGPSNESIQNAEPQEIASNEGIRSAKERLPIVIGVGLFWGFFAGAYLGGRQSSLQYLAENAHKMPKDMNSWYFYHKTKNYKVMLAGIQKGLSYSWRTAAMCGAFTGIEALLDQQRGRRDIINPTVAGITTGSIFSLIGNPPRKRSVSEQ